MYFFAGSIGGHRVIRFGGWGGRLGRCWRLRPLFAFGRVVVLVWRVRGIGRLAGAAVAAVFAAAWIEMDARIVDQDICIAIALAGALVRLDHDFFICAGREQLIL